MRSTDGGLYIITPCPRGDEGMDTNLQFICTREEDFYFGGDKDKPSSSETKNACECLTFGIEINIRNQKPQELKNLKRSPVPGHESRRTRALLSISKSSALVKVFLLSNRIRAPGDPPEHLGIYGSALVSVSSRAPWYYWCSSVTSARVQ